MLLLLMSSPKCSTAPLLGDQPPKCNLEPVKQQFGSRSEHKRACLLTRQCPAAAPQSSAAGRSSAVDIPGILDESLAAGVLSQQAAAQFSAAGAWAGSAMENHIAQYSSR